eukprot:5413852-Prymnesium_polylepis.2
MRKTTVKASSMPTDTPTENSPAPRLRTTSSPEKGQLPNSPGCEAASHAGRVRQRAGKGWRRFSAQQGEGSGRTPHRICPVEIRSESKPSDRLWDSVDGDVEPAKQHVEEDEDEGDAVCEGDVGHQQGDEEAKGLGSRNREEEEREERHEDLARAGRSAVECSGAAPVDG